MSIEEELQECIKKINWTQKKLQAQSDNLEGQIELLWKDIKERLDRTGSEPTRAERIELLTRFCLLSQLSGVLDFDRLIEAREKFCEIFPEHFKEYLNHLETTSWEITWSGCLGCRYFSGKCALNLIPIETPTSDHRLKKSCPSRIPKSSKL